MDHLFITFRDYWILIERNIENYSMIDRKDMYFGNVYLKKKKKLERNFANNSSAESY